jgi:hypothetical protein
MDDARVRDLQQRRPGGFVMVWLVALLVASCTGCGGGAPPEGLSLLLVTLDTTRADVLGCYGGSEASTPTLDRVATEGVRFDRCTACTPLTAPSHSTILTGGHGEGLGDYGELNRGFFLYTPTRHVPLIVEGAGPNLASNAVRNELPRVRRALAEDP